MKKLYAIILIIILTTFTLPVSANSSNVDVKMVPINLLTEDEEPVYIGNNYDENSSAGYEDMTDSNGNKYKYRIRYIKRKSTDLTLQQSQFILNLYRGQTKSVTESYTATRSSSVDWSSSSTSSSSFQSAEKGISSSMSTTLQTHNAESASYSISKGTTYVFPEDAPASARYCNIYAGFCQDIYDVVSDYVPFRVYDKKTKVTYTNVTTPPPYPDEDPYHMYEFDITVQLEDGRVYRYHVTCPPHHYEDDYYQIPEVKRVLREYEDGYKHETISGYDFSSREVFYGTLIMPIPYERHVFIY
ncbi:hypothetical protein [Vallitalea guaymasensis]|uniref:Uncharacterized protein n=1 Tax=Vallitalea guaymasensis TaxID=1185412 RepID=A0A8J8SCD1_9FIRM|nr:hypothetical protein [Vallitalea guaymasensis]QUH29544.1 hypothetical protein HYG85_11760 [Vallitalea guaymasensis]